MELDSVAETARLIEGLTAFDDVETAHREATLEWLARTTDVFRRVKPMLPDPHLVSYFVPLDRSQRRILLVEHRLAGLWLPPGGHVDPGEQPAQTVRREALEELRLEAQFLDDDESPFFLTRTRTTGPGQHTDVSMWFLLNATAADSFDWDDREFTSIRWWSPAEISSAPAEEFDPQLSRFLVKLESAAWHR